jgi:hypothetical protein
VLARQAPELNSKHFCFNYFKNRVIYLFPSWPRKKSHNLYFLSSWMTGTATTMPRFLLVEIESLEIFCPGGLKELS